jgi:putative PIN family toxin of toxin-antitoxin system
VRVVLDANVIIAAFAAHGICEAILELCLDTHQILMSEELLGEIADGLKQKIKLPASATVRILGLLSENSIRVTPTSLPSDACRDPKGLHVLGLAVAGSADCLVTGDNDLLVLENISACRILTPRAFWECSRAS